ncbi:MAG: flagellar hook assembly protein FlgD [Magnetospirillum sp.]|nr:flagellar hook assembly protein FlgD [Magnetospirillum sp.]
MTTVDTTNTTSTSNTTSGTSAATGKATLGTNFNTFLNMLTTQLKHQDPLSPMDSTQFTNQLVQFSSVEQQINANSNLEKLIKLQGAQNTASAISYVGQTVEVAGSKLPLQNGSASFSYTLPSAASTCEVQIKDSSGNLVYKTSADTTVGQHQLQWDGTDTAGKTQTDGLYTISVLASGKDGSTLATTTSVYGTVTKLTNDATNGATLEIGAGTGDAKITVTPDKVLSVVDGKSGYDAAQLAYEQQQLSYSKQLLDAYKKANTTTTSGTTP